MERGDLLPAWHRETVMANRPQAGAVWAKSRLRDRIDAVIAHEDAESLTGDHNLAEAVAPGTTLPITDGARQILRAIRGKLRGAVT